MPRISTITCYLVFSLSALLSVTWTSSECNFDPLRATKHLQQITYSKLGDINIGAFMTASSSNGSASCSNQVQPGSIVLEYTEAVAYGVQMVNNNPNILPNLTLGFIEVDECGNGNVALALALQFLPRVQSERQCACNRVNDSVSNSLYVQPEPLCSNRTMPFYDVIGTIGPITTQSSVFVSRLFASAQIPIIGCLTTLDELTGNYHHPYHLRVIAPDKFKILAMLSFIKSNGWSYISVLYSQGEYGEKAMDNIKLSAPKYEICIATSQRISESSDFDDIVDQLMLFQKARVVIMFIYTQQVGLVLASVKKNNASGHFIWVGSDSWNTGLRNSFREYEDDIVGAFVVSYYANLVPDYFKYLRGIRVNSTSNPWFKASWESLTGCSSSDNLTECDPDQDILTSDDFAFSELSSLYIDAVSAFAHAAHNLLSDRCPGVTGSEARQCIQGDILLEYLKNVTFQGYNGMVDFNNNGDAQGTYRISQITYGYKYFSFLNISSSLGLEAREVALYNIMKNTLAYSSDISWDHLQQPSQRIVPDSQRPETWPESVCSAPCNAGEYKITKELPCCWECRPCRDNEIVTKDKTNCQVCPPLTWPNPATGLTTCKSIPLKHQKLTDAVTIFMTCLGIAALIALILVMAGYIHFRETRVIKAASRELSILQILAILVGYITVLIFQIPPNSRICKALFFLFCISFAWLYSPLLVKTIRIYRIFQTSKTANRKPRFINPTWQLFFAGALIGFQVFLCVCISMVYDPTAKVTQPIPTRNYAELSCDLTFPGVASFLAYNLFLISLCLILAFKTRKLPDNFNESKFISLCVTTTLVIWLAFIPTYFTASISSVKMMLLSVALLLNHTVALIFLFIPKIYAAIYVHQDNFVGTRFHSHTPAMITSGPAISNRIMPTQVTNTDEYLG